MVDELKALATAWVASQEIDGERTDAEWEPIFAVINLATDPEGLWAFVLAAEPICKSAKVFDMLGVSPLEDLIQDNGAAFVDRIEQRAKESPRFAELLRRVWVPAGKDPVTLRYLALGCDEVRSPA